MHGCLVPDAGLCHAGRRVSVDVDFHRPGHAAGQQLWKAERAAFPPEGKDLETVPPVVVAPSKLSLRKDAHALPRASFKLDQIWITDCELSLAV